jgi:hypothetical protein
MFDRIKIFEDRILNEGFLLQRLEDLNRQVIDLLYLKIDEGADLKKLKLLNINFIDFLNDYCVRNFIPREKIKIEHDNLLQESFIWPNYVKHFNADPFLHGQRITNINEFDKKITSKFGLFVGGSRWHRLWLASYLYDQHREHSLISYHQHHFNKKLPANLFIDDLFFKLHNTQDTDCLERVNHFCKVLPLHLDDEILNENTGYINYDRAYDLVKFYKNIFVDVVCETWHEGDTFLPTEKTGRCFVSKTPFIIYGPKNYLSNLKKLGFKTFEKIINEKYDRFEGVQRLFEIKKVIEIIGNKEYTELHQMNDSVKDILDHNFNVYRSLTGEKILDVFKQ